MKRKDLVEEDRRLDTAIDKKRAEVEDTRRVIAELEATGVSATIDAEERRLSRLGAARSVLKAHEAELARLQAEEREVTRQIDEERIAELRGEMGAHIEKAATAIATMAEDLDRTLIPIENELRAMGGSYANVRVQIVTGLQRAAVATGLYENYTSMVNGSGIRRRG